jgi:simple sugar transport system substrate-binding protein
MALKLTMAAVVVGLSLSGISVVQAESLNIVFTCHSSASNTFWQAVKKGFNDACSKTDARCQMIFTQTEGSIEEQQANMQAAIARHPDALITSIVDDHAFDQIIADAREEGIIVIAANVDDSEGAKGNERQAFIGQNFIPAGYALSQAISAHFPAQGPIHVLVGLSAPGQNWSEQRAQGIIDFLEAYKKAQPDRLVTWNKIDSGTDLAITGDRVGAYLAAHPDTTAYIDTGFWCASVARVLQDRGVAPGKVLLGGFDLVPEVLQEMKAGYVQALVDQQPYEQGFMPVMEVYLAKKIGLAPVDINTGSAIVTPSDVDNVLKLSAQGLR